MDRTYHASSDDGEVDEFLAEPTSRRGKGREIKDREGRDLQAMARSNLRRGG